MEDPDAEDRWTVEISKKKVKKLGLEYEKEKDSEGDTVYYAYLPSDDDDKVHKAYKKGESSVKTSIGNFDFDEMKQITKGDTSYSVRIFDPDNVRGVKKIIKEIKKAKKKD